MPPPLLQFFFCQHTYRKNVYRDEGVILSHICWVPGGPLPFSRPQTPPRPSPPPPPPRPRNWLESGRESAYGPLLRPPRDSAPDNQLCILGELHEAARCSIVPTDKSDA